MKIRAVAYPSARPNVEDPKAPMERFLTKHFRDSSFADSNDSDRQTQAAAQHAATKQSQHYALTGARLKICAVMKSFAVVRSQMRLCTFSALFT